LHAEPVRHLPDIARADVEGQLRVDRVIGGERPVGDRHRAAIRVVV